MWDILSAIDEINAFTKGFDVEKLGQEDISALVAPLRAWVGK